MREQIADHTDDDIRNATINRTLNIYNMMGNRSDDEAETAREKLTRYIETLVEAGENNAQRLTVYGLTFLRELDHRNDPQQRGFTGM